MNLLPYARQFAAQKRGKAAGAQNKQQAQQAGLNLALKIIDVQRAQQDFQMAQAQMDYEKQKAKFEQDKVAWTRLQDVQDRLEKQKTAKLEGKLTRAQTYETTARGKTQEALAGKYGREDQQPQTSIYDAFGKVDPSEFTPESVAAFYKSYQTNPSAPDYGLLQPAPKTSASSDAAITRSLIAGMTDPNAIAALLISKGVPEDQAMMMAQSQAQTNLASLQKTQAGTAGIEATTEKTGVETALKTEELKNAPMMWKAKIEKAVAEGRLTNEKANQLGQMMTANVSKAYADANNAWAEYQATITGKPADTAKAQLKMYEIQMNFIRTLAGQYMQSMSYAGEIDPATIQQEATTFATGIWDKATKEGSIKTNLEQSLQPTGGGVQGGMMPIPPDIVVPGGNIIPEGAQPQRLVPPEQYFIGKGGQETERTPAYQALANQILRVNGNDPQKSLAYVKNNRAAIEKQWKANGLGVGNMYKYILYYFEKGIYGKGKPKN